MPAAFAFRMEGTSTWSSIAQNKIPSTFLEMKFSKMATWPLKSVSAGGACASSFNPYFSPVSAALWAAWE
jgi:hypothetical protein